MGRTRWGREGGGDGDGVRCGVGNREEIEIHEERVMGRLCSGEKGIILIRKERVRKGRRAEESEVVLDT